MKLLLTAVSHKNGGLCIAGLTTTGELIRPLYASAHDGTWPTSLAKVGPNRREISPLDVVELSLAPTSKSEVARDEDRDCNGPIKYLRSRTVIEVQDFLRESVKPTWLLDDQEKFVKPRQPMQKPREGTLALIRVSDVEVSTRPHDSAKLQVSFTYKKRRYLNFALSAIDTKDLMDPNGVVADYWLCISLGLPWGIPTGEIRQYKLVAGAWKAA